VLREGSEILIVGFGPIVMRGIEVADGLAADGWSVGVINARYAKPLDAALISQHARGKKLVVTLEESVVTGGFGSAVLEALAAAALDDETLRVPVKIVGLPADHFVDHGAVNDLRRYLRIDADGITEQVNETLTELHAVPAQSHTAKRRPIEARSA